MYKLILCLLIVLMSAVAVAGTAAPLTEDPALDRRVQALAEELRCLVCQNQSLADSQAELALDLKNQVREKFKQGASEQEVIAFMVERYGDFVLYRPPVKIITLLLWFGPGLLFIVGMGALFVRLRRRNTVEAEPDLSEEERLRLASLLDSGTSVEGGR
jgi:cytochrome c-type biogenesis protein CcmH